MRDSLVILSLLLSSVSSPALAQSRDDARPSDVQRLQDDLSNLDEELALLETGDRTADEFRSRGEEIREEAIYFKVMMRRHQRDGREGTGVLYDEVVSLQQAIRDLREDMRRAFAHAQRDERLPEGTTLTLRLEQSLSSRTARREDRFDATVYQPVRGERAVAVPAGSRVRGVVRDAEPAQRASRSGRLELEFDILYVDRARVDIDGRVVSVGAQEDRLNTKEKAGIGAVLGGVLGGILGGKRGAIAGILVGGTGAVAATKGDDVELPAGTLVTVQLKRPVDIPSP